MQSSRSRFRKILDCGGIAQRRHRFRAGEQPRSKRHSLDVRKRRGASLPAALQDAGVFIAFLSLAVVVFLSGCATAPRTQIQRPAQTFPADALITQRGLLTVFGGKQFTLNGYLATSATNGQRLVLTENFGGVLADVLVTPDGKAHVMKSSRAFKPKWIERYVAADVSCLFGSAITNNCPGETLGPNHFLIQRRWYKLDVQIVNIQPGSQPATLFDATQAEKP